MRLKIYSLNSSILVWYSEGLFLKNNRFCVIVGEMVKMFPNVHSSESFLQCQIVKKKTFFYVKFMSAPFENLRGKNIHT